MKVAQLGATGSAGSALLNEALNRGHEVTAINYAVAIIDELETPARSRQRFTVGY